MLRSTGQEFFFSAPSPWIQMSTTYDHKLLQIIQHLCCLEMSIFMVMLHSNCHDNGYCANDCLLMLMRYGLSIDFEETFHNCYCYCYCSTMHWIMRMAIIRNDFETHLMRTRWCYIIFFNCSLHLWNSICEGRGNSRFILISSVQLLTFKFVRLSISVINYANIWKKNRFS